MNEYVTDGRVTRWLLLLQEFDITTVDKPGKDNIVADFLSRLTNNSDDSHVEDSFPDDHLFVVSTHSPWYANIANYLIARKIPPHLSPRECRNIIQRSAQFSWVGECLFYTGHDLEIRRCIREDEIHDILKACHDEPCSGNFAHKITWYK
jgi:hypothetical protein